LKVVASTGKTERQSRSHTGRGKSETAEADYQRAETLYLSGVSSKAELDHALALRDTAAALLESARQSSAMTDIGPRTEEIRAAPRKCNR